MKVSQLLFHCVCLFQFGSTALIVSAEYGHLEVVQLLLDRGAHHPNAKIKVGNY